VAKILSGRNGESVSAKSLKAKCIGAAFNNLSGQPALAGGAENGKRPQLSLKEMAIFVMAANTNVMAAKWRRLSKATAESWLTSSASYVMAGVWLAWRNGLKADSESRESHVCQLKVKNN
jgi:hypothetical protein